MARISVPTSTRLPSSLRIDASNPAAVKILSRLTRPSLLSLALDWLDENNQALCAPYLRPAEEDDEDEDPGDFYPPAHSPHELRESYIELQARKGSKREVIDRILEGDWRHGLTMYQLAMADLQYLYDHPTSQKWSAYRIAPLKTPSRSADGEEPAKIDRESVAIPRFHPSTFLKNLQAQVPPDVKVHYNFDRHKVLPLLLLRIFILDSPYNTNLAVTGTGGSRTPANFDAARTVYVAFPDASPHIYISKSQAVGAAGLGESKSLRSVVLEGIPKALSRPRERYTLRSTSLSTRNLSELLHRRGSGRTNTAGGGWSIYADGKKKESPLDTVLPTPPLSEDDKTTSQRADEHPRKSPSSPDSKHEERSAKRRRLVAQARFGDSAKISDGKGVERVDIVVEDAFPNSSRVLEPEGGQDEEQGTGGDASSRRKSHGGRRSQVDVAFQREAEALEEDDVAGNRQEDEQSAGGWRPEIRLTFHGSHVFAGLRQLVEAGVIDGERMPGWMTGEEGVTIGAVRHGRIRGHKGSGV